MRGFLRFVNAQLFGRFRYLAAFNALGADISGLRFTFQYYLLFVEVRLESSFCFHMGMAVRVARYGFFPADFTFI
jgi:hypothetical protein